MSDKEGVLAIVFDENSPLRRVPAGLDKKQILFLDGIRYSVEMTDLAYGRLYANAAQMTKDLVTGQQEQNPVMFTAAITDAWSIIDSTHRLRELLWDIWDMPGITKKKQSLELRRFRQSTANIEQLRHKVQHLKGEIRPLAKTDQPVWGFLTWFSRYDEEPNIVRRLQLAAGTLFPGAGPEFKLGEIQLASPVDQFELTAHGIRVSLTQTYESVVRIARATEAAFAESFKALPPEAKPAGADVLVALELRLGEQGQPPPASG